MIDNKSISSTYCLNFTFSTSSIKDHTITVTKSGPCYCWQSGNETACDDSANSHLCREKLTGKEFGMKTGRNVLNKPGTPALPGAGVP